MTTRGWSVAVIHNGAHLFVISSRQGDSRKQRTGHGGAEQKAIRSTTVQPPRTAAREGVVVRAQWGWESTPLLLLASSGRERRDERKKVEGGAIGRERVAKCRELPVRKRTFRAVIFISFSRKTLPLTRARPDLRSTLTRERRCRFSREIARSMSLRM